MTDTSATAILGPQCPACGWRGGKHRPAAPGMGMEACPRSEGNPDPGRIRLWRVPNPYKSETCTACGKPIPFGETISIEYEQGVSHADCIN